MQSRQNQTFTNGFTAKPPLIGRTQTNFNDQTNSTLFGRGLKGQLIDNGKDLKGELDDLTKDDLKERLIVAEKVMKSLFQRIKELE